MQRFSRGSAEVQYSNEISRMDAVIKEAKEKLEAWAEERRRGEESIHTNMDRIIFEKHGANRAHHFGCAFDGDIRGPADQGR